MDTCMGLLPSPATLFIYTFRRKIDKTHNEKATVTQLCVRVRLYQRFCAWNHYIQRPKHSRRIALTWDSGRRTRHWIFRRGQQEQTKILCFRNVTFKHCPWSSWFRFQARGNDSDIAKRISEIGTNKNFLIRTSSLWRTKDHLVPTLGIPAVPDTRTHMGDEIDARSSYLHSKINHSKPCQVR